MFRRVTSVGQKIPPNAPELCDDFLSEMEQLKRYDVSLNMDETPLYFDIPGNSTIDVKGVKTVKLKTTGYEKLRFSAVLTAGVQRLQNGYCAFRLPIMFIFKNLKKAPKGNFPVGTVVEASKGGVQ